jgi:dipeptidyl-peptidase-4
VTLKRPSEENHVNHAMKGVLVRAGLVLPAALVLLQATTGAQDRLKTMPGYERYDKIGRQVLGAVKSGAVTGRWKDAQTFEFTRDAKTYRFDLGTRQTVAVSPLAEAEPAGAEGGRGGLGPLERGRQPTLAESPDKKLKAFYRDRNLWLSDAAGANETQLTTDGSDKARIKYGTASWVYGEELEQTSAMWWSPDSRKLAYYRFDEKQVPDYYLQLRQTQLQSEIDTEAYPKAGKPNPVVDLFVYDVATRTTAQMDVRDGKPFDNSVVGHYVYHVQWSPDGRELLFNRTNRRQNILELTAANPDTGATRVIVREEWPTGWIENNPQMQFLQDGRRFIWASERTGWNNLYLYDLSGKLLSLLTSHATFEVADLVKVDERLNTVFYTARDGDNLLKVQLHRVGLDGKGDVRLTDPAYHHTVGSCTGVRRSGPGRGPAASCGVSPDSRYFVDVYQTHDVPAATRIVDAVSGKTVAELATSDLSKFNELGLKRTELFTFLAADGKTTLRGLIHFPSDFNASRKYPALVSVYGGPASASNTARETFVVPSPLTEYGFLVVNLDSRAAPGMGKRTLDAIYMKLGQVEIDDMAEGVKALSARPYFDRTRVGIYGTSYGGYASLMSLLRYPDVFAAASASSPVTAWNHYDTIYTERYMWLPEENKANYEAGSAMTHAKELKGRLMLYYGTADNNVHPSNMMQLVAALQQAGKSFDLQVGPDRGHSGLNVDRMMEFFIEHLVMWPTAVAGSGR